MKVTLYPHSTFIFIFKQIQAPFFIRLAPKLDKLCHGGVETHTHTHAYPHTHTISLALTLLGGCESDRRERKKKIK